MQCKLQSNTCAYNDRLLHVYNYSCLHIFSAAKGSAIDLPQSHNASTDVYMLMSHVACIHGQDTTGGE